MKECLFCQIGRRELPAKFVYEDPDLFAFEDIAPFKDGKIASLIGVEGGHSLGEGTDEHGAVLGRALVVASQLAAERQLTDGYRVVVNNGRRAGQTVFHLHFHLLGGRDFRWPPG